MMRGLTALTLAIVDAQALGHAALVGLQDDVGGGGQGEEGGAPLRPGEVDGHAALVAVDGHEHGALAAVLRAVDGAGGVAARAGSRP